MTDGAIGEAHHGFTADRTVAARRLLYSVCFQKFRMNMFNGRPWDGISHISIGRTVDVPLDAIVRIV